MIELIPLILLIIAETVIAACLIILGKKIDPLIKNIPIIETQYKKEMQELRAELIILNNNLTEPVNETFDTYKTGQLIGQIIVQILLMKKPTILGFLFLVFEYHGRVSDTVKSYRKFVDSRNVA